MFGSTVNADSNRAHSCYGRGNSFFFVANSLVLLAVYVGYSYPTIMKSAAKKWNKFGTVASLVKTTSNSSMGSPYRGIDVFIVGFAKCGTTSLSRLVDSYENAVVPEREIYVLRNPGSDLEALRELDDILHQEENKTTRSPSSSLPSSLVLGIKDPDELLAGAKGVRYLVKYNPQRTPKLIIGLRHPILLFESFYNYRVNSFHSPNSWMKDIKGNTTIPPPSSLKEKAWYGVGGPCLRFELYLSHLNDVSNFTILLYDVEQLKSHSTAFQETLQTFLRLQNTSLAKPPHSNQKRDKPSFNETIRICSDEFIDLRGFLVRQATETVAWILESFIQQSNVIVTEREQFRRLVAQYSIDPCIPSEPSE